MSIELLKPVAGKPLAGRIITWELSKLNVSHATVVANLGSNGLDQKVARALCSTSALRRALRKMSDERVIHKLSNNKENISFQFTKFANDGERINYDFETVVTLDKETGRITCANPEIESFAQVALDAAIENRTTSDISKIVQLLFEQQTDLFPIKKRGGVYFVVEEQVDFCERVNSFLESINGELTQLIVDGGSGDGTNQSIKKIVASGLSDLAGKLREKIEMLDDGARGSTLEKRATDINELRFKLESYAVYLGEAQSGLSAEIDGLNELLRTKIAGIGATPVEGEVA